MPLENETKLTNDLVEARVVSGRPVLAGSPRGDCTTGSGCLQVREATGSISHGQHEGLLD